MQTNNRLRKALVEIRRELDGYCNGRTLLDRMTEDPPDYTCLRDSLLEINRIVIAALAEPPRNCDVGTIDDQKDRFLEFCDEEKGPREHCRNCRLCNSSDCELAWAQMAYEKGGAE